ncbi:hypothetical protein PUG46_19335 [Erwiniaceae bacterium L1_55_4]|nr:hypothetical protein [Erwiniaceae bacterium L1_55_4]
MERCQNCHLWYGEPKPVQVGDQVAFTFSRIRGKRVEVCGRVGKLMLIKDSGGYSVSYRGTRYHADEVSLADEPSPLTLAFAGRCECSKVIRADATKGGSDD